MLGKSAAARAVGRVGARAAGPRVVGGVRKVGALGAAAGLGAGATAAAIAGAFALGYGIGTGLRYAWKYLSKDERAFRAATAFRDARKKFTQQYGRAPNREEVQQLAAGFREALEKR